ncbi:MAG: NADH-quinone oxidoreductase subunit M [Candidatus Izimaplasma sp.]|nr:NADH-quinone oxidoreductase subunit M [Candidatus Izimaplasma bacterium]
MASIELLLLFTLAAGVLAFFASMIHKLLGPIVTILASLFVFVSITYFGYNGELDMTVSYLPYVSFGFSYAGLFFAIIVTFIYSMVSFYNPFFAKKYKSPAVYSMFYLFNLVGIIGVFFTNNFLVLFFFFEFLVWTSFFLISFGKSRKAAISYFGFSSVGGFALLYAIFIMHNAAGTFNINAGLAVISGTDATLVFILFMISAFSKLGAFPLHIWLPFAHGNAPHHFSPVLSGALVKLGAFVGVMGLLRITTTTYFINAIGLDTAHYIIAILGALTIVFGTLMAIRQDDAKKLLAYSSMSHGGYILVALTLGTSLGVAGGLYHVVAHGLSSAAAFLAIAAVSRQTGTTKMSELGGMIHKMPITYVVYLIAIISMAGIPPMGGFISKWLIFQAVIDQGLIFVAIAVFFGSIGSFLYVFRPLASLFLGQELPKYKDKIKEAPFFMLVPMIIFSVLIIYTGVFPNFFLEFINNIVVEVGIAPITLNNGVIYILNGTLYPTLIAAVFGVGVIIAFIIFLIFPKSRKVGLMDTYTAAEFIYTEELLHYSNNFYAPIERLYEKYIDIMEKFYEGVSKKVNQIGRFFKYYFFSNKPEITVFWIIILIMVLLLGGDLL